MGQYNWLQLVANWLRHAAHLLAPAWHKVGLHFLARAAPVDRSAWQSCQALRSNHASNLAFKLQLDSIRGRQDSVFLFRGPAVQWALVSAAGLTLDLSGLQLVHNAAFRARMEQVKQLVRALDA